MPGAATSKMMFAASGIFLHLASTPPFQPMIEHE